MVNQKKYKVLHIFSSYGGGISSLILSLIENKEEKFKFDIMAFSYKNGEKFLERVCNMGGDVYQMPRPRMDGYKNFKNYIEDVISNNNYDAIHCHITGCHAKPFMDIAKRHDIKSFVLHAHTTKYDSRIDRLPFMQIYDRCINYRSSAAYMTCSDMAAKYIYGEKFLKKRRAYFIPNGIKESFFLNELDATGRAEYNKEFSIPEDALVIGHVGRFSNQKNHFFIIEIAKELRKKDLSFVMVLVGTGELFDSVKEKIAEYGLCENIRLIGRRTDIPLLMQYFDCMILPSFYEGLPTVAVECQAAGTKMFLSEKITKQCDMNLGLLKFLPIDNGEIWAENIKTVNLNIHLNNVECINQIKKLGFTAEMSGKHYCSILKEIIVQNG